MRDSRINFSRVFITLLVSTLPVRGQVLVPDKILSGLSYHSGNWVTTLSSVKGVTRGIPFEGETHETVTLRPPYGTESRTQHGRLFRDTNGRISFETFMDTRLGRMREATFIDDPISGVRSTISASLRKVWNYPYSPDDGVGGVTPDRMKKLGQKVVEGVHCDGYWFDSREDEIEAESTTRYTIEAWISEDLNLVLLVVETNEKSDSRYSLFNLRWGEPARSHFAVPSDYFVRTVGSD